MGNENQNNQMMPRMTWQRRPEAGTERLNKEGKYGGKL
jgi:hypothetical protein